MSGYAQPQQAQMARPNEPWVDPVFYLLVGGVVAVISAALIPIFVVALGTFIAIKLLRVPWWIFFSFFIVLMIAFIAFDMSPIESIARVFRKLMRFLNGGHFLEFDFLIHKLFRWWRLQFPEVVPAGAALGAILEGLLPLPAPPWHPKAERQMARATDVARRDASRVVRLAPDSVRGVPVLGADIGGDMLGVVKRDARGRRWFTGSPSFFAHPSLVVGQPGTGKTTTLLRIGYLAAKVLGSRVYFLDGKGDFGTQRDFIATMLQAGMDPEEIGAFPQASFHGWRTCGSPDERYTQLLSRLLAVVRSTEPYYEDTTRHFIARAIKEGDGLPESSSELISRLNQIADSLSGDRRERALETSMRFEAFFDSFHGGLDGGWDFSDKRAAYVLLRGASQEREAGRLAEYLFECFKHFATETKPSFDEALLIVDEFPALQQDADVAGLLERLRSFGCSVVLSAQSFDGLGSERERIVGAAHTVILHRTPLADELVRVAGTIKAHAVTSQIHLEAGMTGRGTTTPEHRFRVDPNDVRTLDRGEVVMISAGQAERARIAGVRPNPEMTDYACRLLGSLVLPKAPTPDSVASSDDVLEY